LIVNDLTVEVQRKLSPTAPVAMRKDRRHGMAGRPSTADANSSERWAGPKKPILLARPCSSHWSLTYVRATDATDQVLTSRAVVAYVGVVQVELGLVSRSIDVLTGREARVALEERSRIAFVVHAPTS